MSSENKHTLILISVNQGYTETVLKTARSLGARGGTILRARWSGVKALETYHGISLQTEKEIIAIIVPRSIKQGLMQEINRVAGLSTEKAGILFSLPIGDMAGLNFDSLG